MKTVSTMIRIYSCGNEGCPNFEVPLIVAGEHLGEGLYAWPTADLRCACDCEPMVREVHRRAVLVLP